MCYFVWNCRNSWPVSGGVKILGSIRTPMTKVLITLSYVFHVTVFVLQSWKTSAFHKTAVLHPNHTSPDNTSTMTAVQLGCTWKGEARMFLFTASCTFYCDLKQQSNCHVDERKQSAAHPHTAGCWHTKDDYLHWYKKQCILFLRLKINPSVYSNHMSQRDWFWYHSGCILFIYPLQKW